MNTPLLNGIRKEASIRSAYGGLVQKIRNLANKTYYISGDPAGKALSRHMGLWEHLSNTGMSQTQRGRMTDLLKKIGPIT
jgi:hypothetical protein